MTPAFFFLASDDVEVVGVDVVIQEAGGAIIEQGAATLTNGLLSPPAIGTGGQAKANPSAPSRGAFAIGFQPASD